MTGRERALAALDHREPDCVPVDYWSTPEADARLCGLAGLADRAAIMDSFGVDFVYIEGPGYVGPALAGDSPGETLDIWGVPRRTQLAGTGPATQSYRTVTAYPLAGASGPEDVLEYGHWPEMDWLDFSVVREQCRAGGDRCVMFMGDRLNRIAQLKPAMYLRGVAQVFEDMVFAPELFSALIERIAGFYLDYMTRILEAAGDGIDILVTGDDFGMQEGMLCSPDMWRRFLQPGFRRFIERAHDFGIPVMHHTCGSVYPIIPDMIDCGLDVLNPIQPGVRDMDHGRLKREFGERLAFHGGISIQGNLPRGKPDDVRDEVRRLMDTMKPGGGFWACTAHNIQADVPPENTLAMFESYREFGACGR